MEKSSLYRDLVRNPRESEDSRIVAAKWGATVDAYLPEIPDASSLQYFNLSAERLLYRSKILSLTIDQELAESEALQTARPFGKGGPTFAMLRDSSVRMAMAFVPLTPTGGNGKAILARLYCVTGLSDKNKPPFEKGVDSPDIDKYSWFAAGIPAVFEGEMLSGRSWLLAAHLLMQVVNAKDNATARNLATNFIITGDVESGSIKEVDMGQKPNLANIKEYRAYKWIIPMKNANEMTNVPSRKIEKPATLEEAYKLIETMQNKATRSFFRFLKEGNLEGMKELYDIGADVYAEDEDTKLTPLELNAKQLNNVHGKIAIRKSNEHFGDDEIPYPEYSELKRHESIEKWLLQFDCALAFYQLARNGMRDPIACLSQFLPITAKDKNGLTALDYAIINADFQAIQVLLDAGCVSDKCGRKNKSLFALAVRATMWTSEMSDYDWRLLEAAFVGGLSPSGMLIPYHTESDDIRTSLFGRALLIGNERLIRLCLMHGADPNAKVEFKSYEIEPNAGKETILSCWEVSPAEILKNSDSIGRERVQPLLSILKAYGCKE